MKVQSNCKNAVCRKTAEYKVGLHVVQWRCLHWLWLGSMEGGMMYRMARILLMHASS